MIKELIGLWNAYGKWLRKYWKQYICINVIIYGWIYGWINRDLIKYELKNKFKKTKKLES